MSNWIKKYSKAAAASLGLSGKPNRLNFGYRRQRRLPAKMSRDCRFAPLARKKYPPAGQRRIRGGLIQYALNQGLLPTIARKKQEMMIYYSLDNLPFQKKGRL